MTSRSKPRTQASPWGKHLGIAATTPRRVWQSNGLQPHVSQTFKRQRNASSEDKS